MFSCLIICMGGSIFTDVPHVISQQSVGCSGSVCWFLYLCFVCVCVCVFNVCEFSVYMYLCDCLMVCLCLCEMNDAYKARTGDLVIPDPFG